MTALKLTAALAKEYNDLFNRCEIAADKMTEVEGVVQRILDFQNRYAAIAAQSTVPWYVIAVTHNMDCGLDFTKHLHNGDSLKRRTVNVPAGRPETGQPPFTFEVSALKYDGFTAWSDWSCFASMRSRRHPSTHERPWRYRSCFTAFIQPCRCRRTGRGSAALISMVN